MVESDIIDDVNALLKLGVGDAYRLEHIKQSYIQNKNLWSSDGNYLQQMREKYLVKYNPELQNEQDAELDSDEKIHCWKCGKKNPLEANFCMICGVSLFEVGEQSEKIPQTTREEPKTPRKPTILKLPIIIGIPVLILIVLGAGYSQGMFDNVLDRYNNASSNGNVIEKTISNTGSEQTVSTETNSKCGEGTMYDSKSNTCILDK